MGKINGHVTVMILLVFSFEIKVVNFVIILPAIPASW